MPPYEIVLLLALGLVFIPLEWVRPVRRAPADWSRLRTDALHVVFSGAMVRWSVAVLMTGLAFALARAAPGWIGGLAAQVRAQPGWLQFGEILLISDFLFYGTHRLRHAVPFLWRFHEVHHSSEKLDWIAGHRVHPVDQIIESAVIAAPAVILGFAPGPLLAYALLYRWHAVFLHANVEAPFGPLKWIIASPQYHHWHHADQAWAYDRNFGGQLVIFDRLFGTLNLPRGMPEKYGLSAPIARDYLGQMLHPFRRLRQAPRPDAAAGAGPEPSLSGS